SRNPANASKARYAGTTFLADSQLRLSSCPERTGSIGKASNRSNLDSKGRQSDDHSDPAQSVPGSRRDRRPGRADAPTVSPRRKPPHRPHDVVCLIRVDVEGPLVAARVD